MAASIRSLRNGATAIDGASRDDLVVGDVVTLSSVGGAATTYNWSLAFKPNGSTAVFSGTSTNSSPGTFTVDLAGAYLVRLVVDAGEDTESTQTVRLRVLTSGGLKLLAAGERRDTNGTVPVDASAAGWAHDQNYNLQTLEALAQAADGVDVEDESVSVGRATTLNFTGAGVTVTDAGSGVVDITIPGGGGGSSATSWTNTTTNATPTELFTDGVSARYALADNSAVKFTWEVIARSTAGAVAGFKVSGVIKRNSGAGTTALVGTPVLETTGADSALSTATVTATADAVNGALAPQVTGVAATTIEWVVVMTEATVVG